MHRCSTPVSHLRIVLVPRNARVWGKQRPRHQKIHTIQCRVRQVKVFVPQAKAYPACNESDMMQLELLRLAAMMCLLAPDAASVSITASQRGSCSPVRRRTSRSSSPSCASPISPEQIRFSRMLERLARMRIRSSC